MKLPTEILIRDVTLRDGLQDLPFVPTEDKHTLYKALISSGIAELELTSFVRADKVPSLADAKAFTALTNATEVVRWALVLNLRGAELALNTGIRHLQFVISVSEDHNRNNTGKSCDESLHELSLVNDLANEFHAVTEITIATSFGCPHTGVINSNLVHKFAEKVRRAGVSGITFADTIGTATPLEVESLIKTVVANHSDIPIGIHLHDTRGLAISNALVAIEHGVSRVDGSLGGLGGCPFAPGATGNLALEDLVHALNHMGVRTGINLDQLITASKIACAISGHTMSSHVGIAGDRFAVLVPRV